MDGMGGALWKSGFESERNLLGRARVNLQGFGRFSIIGRPTEYSAGKGWQRVLPQTF